MSECETVRGLAGRLQLADPELGNHVSRVVLWMGKLIDRVYKETAWALTDEHRKSLLYAAQLHDIGLTTYTLSVFCRDIKTTLQNRDVFKFHAYRGVKVIQPFREELSKELEYSVLQTLVQFHHTPQCAVGLDEKLYTDLLMLVVSDSLDINSRPSRYIYPVNFEEALAQALDNIPTQHQDLFDLCIRDIYTHNASRIL